MDTKSIWIWGDSWGVPNYAMPRAQYRSRYHVSEILADMGHDVDNFAQNGSSNLASMERSENVIPGLTEPVDWIIWFHTALFRDCDHAGLRKSNYSSAMLEPAAKLTYTKAMDVVDSTRARLIFIEGHAPVYEPVFSEIVQPFHSIRNWRGQILETPDLPQSHWYCQSQDLMNEPELTLQQKQTELENLETMQDALCKSSLFVDNSHPGDYAHIQLSAEILQIIYNN